MFEDKVKFTVVETYIQGVYHQIPIATFNTHSERKRLADKLNEENTDNYIKYYIRIEWKGVNND